MRNSISLEAVEAVKQKLVEHLPDVVREIDDIISQIVMKVRQLSPQEILKHAYWELARYQLGTQSELEVRPEGMVSQRMIDYVQSIIVSVPPAEPNNLECSEQDWLELRSLVEKLFVKLNGEFFICQTSLKDGQPSSNPDVQDFFFKAQLYWCNVRGHRYLVHNIPFLLDVVMPHDEILQELYGIGAQEFVHAFEKIQHSQIFGIGELFDEMACFHKDCAEELEKTDVTLSSNASDPGSVVSQIIQEKGWNDRRDNLAARFSGMDLHDVEKLTGLPKVLLEDLSWRPGQDKEFFSEGDYRGWPLREWPVRKRPFLKLGERYYCFDNFSLFDNLYRVIQRTIIKRKPAYAALWKDKQQEVSERVAIQLFRKLLPNAQVFSSIHYRWHTGSGGDKNWCEVDGLILYEDHLIIVEVKGGAFTYTSPATDFNAYYESVKNLVLKPAEQGKRFVSYLKSASAVKLHDKSHAEIGVLCRSQFEHVTICAVTLDPFTEIASRTQHFKKLGIDLGTHPIWSISIDDLRIYAEIFNNPLMFLHYIEERTKASNLGILETEDELDHLGLYLKHNIYTRHVATMNSTGSVIRFHGYREDIDRFFSQRITDPAVACSLRQKMPHRLEEILDLLGSSEKYGRRKVVSTLLNISGEWRTKIAGGIEEQLRRRVRLEASQALSLHGGEVGITVFCISEDMRGVQHHQELMNHTRSVMLAVNDSTRLLLLLYYDDKGRLLDVDHQFLSLAEISTEELPMLRSRAEKLTQQRLSKAALRSDGIGRNQLCPCGNGKKYKKCHGS